MIKTPQLYVAHIIKEIDFLQDLAEATDFEHFKNDALRLRAAAYSVQIISEAVRNLPVEWLADYDKINWKDVRGLGNVTRHEYFRVDAHIIWQIIVDDLQYLHEAMTDFQNRKLN